MARVEDKTVVWCCMGRREQGCL